MIASATSPDDDEEIVHTAVDNGIVWARTRIDRGSNTYDLYVRRLCADDDPHEPNDGLDGATPVGMGVLEGELCSLYGLDHYAYTLRAGEQVRFDATFAHALGDVDLDVRNADGEVVASSTTNTDAESIVYTPAQDETVAVLVSLAEIDHLAGTNYTLEATRTCVDDDGYAAGSVLLEGDTTGLTLCVAPDDSFHLDLVAGETVQIEADATVAGGSVGLTLVGMGGEVLVEGPSLVYTAGVSQIATLRVRREDGGLDPLPYTLSVSRTGGALSCATVGPSMAWLLLPLAYLRRRHRYGRS